MSDKQCDLHLHSYYSDGKEAPRVLLERGRRAGLKLISITDHNTIAPLADEQRLAAKLKVNLLPGVELSCQFGGRHLHMTGYGFDPDDRGLQKCLEKIQANRRRDIFSLVPILQGLGYDLRQEELEALPAQYLGVIHIYRLLMAKPVERQKIIAAVGSEDLFAVIKHYFSPGQPCFVAEYHLPAEEAIALIHAGGGIIALAHPGSHLKFGQDAVIEDLARAGLDALEVFTPKHNWDQIIHYELLARRLKLAITAGSNYHEDVHRQDVPVITPLGFLKSPPGLFDSLCAYLKARTKFRIRYP